MQYEHQHDPATQKLLDHATEAHSTSMRKVGKHVLLTTVWAVMGVYLVIAAIGNHSSWTLTLSVIALYVAGMHGARYRDALWTARYMRALVARIEGATEEGQANV